MIVVFALPRRLWHREHGTGGGAGLCRHSAGQEGFCVSPLQVRPRLRGSFLCFSRSSGVALLLKAVKGMNVHDTGVCSA